MRLRLLTINVWGLPWPISRDLEGRIRAIGEALPSLDVEIAAFQEVWTEGARDELVSAGRQHGFDFAWHRPEALDSGLLVLSRLPIADARFEPFKLNGFPERIDQADYYGGKGFATLTISTNAGDVAVVTTHLQAGYGKRARDRYLGHRTAQVVSIADSLRSRPEPVVVLGDFNFQDMYQEHTVLTGLAGLQDVALHLDQREDTVLRSNPYRADMTASSSRIDLVFARDGIDRSLRPVSSYRVLSDLISIDGHEARHSNHAGVRTEFEVVQGGAPVSQPRRDALALARSILVRGQRDAEERQANCHQFGVAAGLAILPSAWAARQSSPLTRRGFLRGCGIGGGMLAAGVSGGAFWLSHGFGESERLAYSETLAALDTLERDGM